MTAQRRYQVSAAILVIGANSVLLGCGTADSAYQHDRLASGGSFAGGGARGSPSGVPPADSTGGSSANSIGGTSPVPSSAGTVASSGGSAAFAGTTGGLGDGSTLGGHAGTGELRATGGEVAQSGSGGTMANSGAGVSGGLGRGGAAGSGTGGMGNCIGNGQGACSGVLSFQDAAVEQAVRGALGASQPGSISPYAGPICAQDAARLERLSLSGIRVAHAEDLDCFSGLVELNLVDTGITQLTMLANFRALEILYISSNGFDSLAPLSALTHLKSLYAENTNITDLTAISPLTSLTALYLTSNGITDLTPLSGLTHLERLDLDHNRIRDISALTGIATLNILQLSYNEISSIAPLAGLTALHQATLDHNRISDLGPLVTNSGLGAGDSLWLKNNLIDCTAQANAVSALEARQVTLYDDCP